MKFLPVDPWIFEVDVPTIGPHDGEVVFGASREHQHIEHNVVIQAAAPDLINI